MNNILNRNFFIENFNDWSKKNQQFKESGEKKEVPYLPIKSVFVECKTIERERGAK